LGPGKRNKKKHATESKSQFGTRQKSKSSCKKAEFGGKVKNKHAKESKSTGKRVKNHMQKSQKAEFGGKRRK
jgi:hypothetical protein